MDNSTSKVLYSDHFENDVHQFRIIMNSLGVVLSFIGYGIMVLTAIIFPVWRRTKQNQLWLHMCGSFIVYFCMHFYTFVQPIKNPMASAIVEHVNKYTVRVALCWMLVGAWLTYKNLVDVFADLGDNFMLKGALFSYLTPIPFAVAMFVLYILDHQEYNESIGVRVGCNWFYEDDNFKLYWILTCILDNFLLVVPIIGSLVLYILVTVSICKNRKVHGQERDLVGTVALGFYFVFTCCVQCAIITSKFIFALTGIWTYVTIVLMSFHVSTYTILFIFCNKLTRQLWLTYLKNKISIPMQNTTSSGLVSKV